MEEIKEKVTSKPRSELLQKSYLILKHTVESCNYFLKAFYICRRRRKGAATDEEQDLLRAMLVFSCAGLDSMLKQIIKDALLKIVNSNEKSHAALRQYVSKRLARKSDIEGALLNYDVKFLSDILMQESPREGLINAAIYDFTSGSLQSHEEIFKIITLFGIDPLIITQESETLKKIFGIRNRIIHEMDINFLHSKRNRNPHAKKDIRKYAELIILISKKILFAVDHTIKPLC